MMLVTQKLYANISDQKKIDKLQKKQINNSSLANNLQNHMPEGTSMMQ